MKNLRRFCLLFLVMIMLLGVTAPAFAEELPDGTPQVEQGCVSLDAKAPLNGNDKLLDTAKAAILYELDSGTMVYAWNPDLQVDPSGMNKLMTALIALEREDPDTVVTVSRTVLHSAALIGSVSAGLKVGEEITMRDLLYCMMVGSANDAAVVIAEHIASSEELFVELMNQRALELGCTNTQFVNSNGLPQKGQYTSARDLAKITAKALENELFTELFCAPNYTVPATNKAKERYIVTTNYLMSKESVKTQFDNRVTGGKTGALSTTDRSLIATAEHGGKRFLTVVMSAQGTVTADGLSVKTFGSFEETRALLDHGFNMFSVRQVLQSGQVLQQYSVAGGESAVAVCPADTVFASLPISTIAEEVSFRCVLKDQQLSAPLCKGQIVGTVQVWFRDICVGVSDLVVMHDVYAPGEHMTALIPSGEEPQDDTLRNWLIIGGVALLAVVIVTCVVLLIVHFVRKHQLERRHKLINGEES
ncbi:MAG: D-alanyl-D-alanine carboxypeptidase [Oscillospiraceae bacterium]|nr:D-alanyl-D-alanine carboxypeptidase [Oscillospiraceae bacterium]